LEAVDLKLLDQNKRNNHKKCVQTLISWYTKHRKMVIAYHNKDRPMFQHRTVLIDRTPSRGAR